jgi:pseudouridine-5'-phosphate glycosidase
MPYPQNLQTAKEVESIVRENGAIPATIAILNGVPCIGQLFLVDHNVLDSWIWTYRTC